MAPVKFQTTVDSVEVINDMVAVTGSLSSINVRAGDKVSDGDICYEVVAVPFYSRIGPKIKSAFFLKMGEYDPASLIGKTLFAQN
jgi:hypothetical protein